MHHSFRKNDQCRKILKEKQERIYWVVIGSSLHLILANVEWQTWYNGNNAQYAMNILNISIC